MAEFDFSDYAVRDMVERNHTPEEIWEHRDHISRLMAVRCETCRRSWPCQTILALREFQADLYQMEKDYPLPPRPENPHHLSP